MREPLSLQLPEVLLAWYQMNQRQLPWRVDRQPYHIWISEIMLQQTRVEAVKRYYIRFLQELPDVAALAACEDARLQKLWEGLGYYSRVRNLKKAARVIMERYGGQFPQEYDLVRALPGIGDYTAGAICSIAFDQPTPAVDGNVLRVVARLTENDAPVDLLQTKREICRQLAQIYPPQAGMFTQALMELGATVCLPNGAPLCNACPCREFCCAYRHQTVSDFPVRLPKRERRVEQHTVLMLRCGDRYALERRPEKGLLAGLWQFPNLPGKLETGEAVEAVERMGMRVQNVWKQAERKHIFTHITWELRGFYMDVAQTTETMHWMTVQQVESQAALPTAFRQFWEGMLDV